MSGRITIDNLSKSLKEYLNGLGLTEEQVTTIITNILVDYATKDELENIDLSQYVTKDELQNIDLDLYQKVEDETLTTEDKTVIGAINEIDANTVSKEEYDAKVAELEASVNEAFQLGNSVKQKLVDTLIAKGADVSTNDSFDILISKITSMNIKPTVNPADGNILVFSVTNGTTIVLQNDLRGDTSAVNISTDWGDGTLNNALSHTYDKAGVYQVTSKYNLIATDGTCDATSVSCLTSIIDLNENITDGSYMFYNCTNLTTVAEFDMMACIMTDMSHMFHGCSSLTAVYSGLWDPCYVTDMSYMFSDCVKLTTVITSTWDLSNLENAEYMFHNCPLLSVMEEEEEVEA